MCLIKSNIFKCQFVDYWVYLYTNIQATHLQTTGCLGVTVRHPTLGTATGSPSAIKHGLLGLLQPKFDDFPMNTFNVEDFPIGNLHLWTMDI